MKRSARDSVGRGFVGTGFVGTTDQEEEKTVMRLFILMCMTLMSALGGWADVVLPCVAQDAAALAGTTCAIGDKAFTFGDFENNTATPIGFVPDVSDSGFTLSGHTEVSQPFSVVFYSLPFTVATLNSALTINGLATQILDPVLSGSGPDNCDRPGCHITDSPFVQSHFGPTAFPFDEYHLENGTLTEFASGSLPIPFSNSLSVLAETEGGGDLASFTGAHFEILQTSPAAVPEPTSFLLLGSAFAAIGIGRRLRNT